MFCRLILRAAVLTAIGCQKNMKEGPQFDSQGIDATTYAPFILHNALYTEWKDVRLEFSDWGWIGSRFGESPNRYYLNGYGIEGLVKAARHSRGLEVEPADMHYNSEGNTCYSREDRGVGDSNAVLQGRVDRHDHRRSREWLGRWVIQTNSQTSQLGQFGSAPLSLFSDLRRWA